MRIVIARVGIVGLAAGIIDDTCLTHHWKRLIEHFFGLAIDFVQYQQNIDWSEGKCLCDCSGGALAIYDDILTVRSNTLDLNHPL